jgi:transcriptional regulator
MEMRGPLDLLVLATLARTGSAHGYALIVALRESTDGALDLAEGTVYPALHRLERDGWVGSEWGAEAGRRRRVYSITAAGRSALAAKKREWSRLVDVVAAVTGRTRKARPA